MDLNRRDLMVTAGAALASSAASGAAAKPKLGVELGCISASKWTPYQYLDWFQKVGIGAAQFNGGTLGVRPGAVDEDELRKVRDYAESKGVWLFAYAGRSICPTSASFDPKAGTAEQQIAQGLKVSRILGAKAMRVVLGNFNDRPEIERHLESMIAVIRKVRSQVRDSGVKLAIENHNADLQAREIKTLIEEVGFDVLGVCLDSGNPLVTLEDPHLTLEVLGPYAVTSHIRDTAVWRVPEGVAVRWINMGEGNVDIDGWVNKFMVMHPDLPVTFENLPNPSPRIVNVFTPDALKYYPKMPAGDLVRFLGLAERGRALPNSPVSTKDRGEQQREDLEVCLRYARIRFGAG